MDELKFKVSTGLKSILGQDLITSDNIAILELVKNSYDAHATRVIITFEKDSIIIADNGKGMSLNDLQNKWLFVGYSAKSDGTEDASYRSKFKRNFAGAKGIGRISCDRLGSEVWLTTKSEDSNTVEIIHVDWNKFEKSLKKEFDKIPIEHESRTEDYIFPGGSTIGTELKITGFRPETPEWTRERITDLKKSLEKMINPFSGSEDFSIEIKARAFEEEDLKKQAQIEAFDESITEEKIAQIRNSIVNGVIQNTIADVLNIKTTLIESRLINGVITTKLHDRGEFMYEIQEINTFDKLEDVTINLYFLNQSAKKTFSHRMGVPPVKYGNVMLFRNGFRVWPYGEPGDDSWKLDQRAQQGYNRFLGTRDLFGRVDVETTDVSAFKEVSSRDGGLIMTDAAKQLMEYFSTIHRRLERYVAGVLWGEGFLRNEYFKSQDLALKAREMLQNIDKHSDSSDSLYQNIGSKVDFLQLIKNLVNDKNIVVKYYNSNLADVLSDMTYADVLQTDFVESLKEVAEKTSDQSLAANITFFEKQLADMRKQKKAAEKIAEAERKAKIKAEREARIAREAKEKVEKELEVKKQQNLYLESHRDTSKEVDDIMHTVLISSTELDSLVKILKILASEDIVDKTELLNTIKDIEFNVERIHMLSSLITKADVSILRDSIELNIYEYTKEFLGILGNSINISFINNLKTEVFKKVQILEWTIVLQNLVSNSKKAEADAIQLTFTADGRKLLLDFSDNGKGVDLEKFTPDSIFEIGITDRQGGSGIGLNTVQSAMRDKLNGSVEFLGNGLNNMKGATFRLTFE
ncbi:MAG: ATP-binding protein [Agathobacter sp.]|nr:ATP-binding protein [Agathobacter sp.]